MSVAPETPTTSATPVNATFTPGPEATPTAVTSATPSADTKTTEPSLSPEMLLQQNIKDWLTGVTQISSSNSWFNQNGEAYRPGYNPDVKVAKLNWDIFNVNIIGSQTLENQEVITYYGMEDKVGNRYVIAFRMGTTTDNLEVHYTNSNIAYLGEDNGSKTMPPSSFASLSNESYSGRRAMVMSTSSLNGYHLDDSSLSNALESSQGAADKLKRFGIAAYNGNASGEVPDFVSTKDKMATIDTSNYDSAPFAWYLFVHN